MAMIDNAAEHHDLAPALQRTHEDGFPPSAIECCDCARSPRLHVFRAWDWRPGRGSCSAGPIIQLGHRVLRHPPCGDGRDTARPGTRAGKVETILASCDAKAAILDASATTNSGSTFLWPRWPMSPSSASASLVAPAIRPDDLATFSTPRGRRCAQGGHAGHAILRSSPPCRACSRSTRPTVCSASCRCCTPLSSPRIAASALSQGTHHLPRHHRRRPLVSRTPARSRHLHGRCPRARQLLDRASAAK